VNGDAEYSTDGETENMIEQQQQKHKIITLEQHEQQQQLITQQQFATGLDTAHLTTEQVPDIGNYVLVELIGDNEVEDGSENTMNAVVKRLLEEAPDIALQSQINDLEQNATVVAELVLDESNDGNMTFGGKTEESGDSIEEVEHMET